MVSCTVLALSSPNEIVDRFKTAKFPFLLGACTLRILVLLFCTMASVNRLRKISDLIGLIIICHIWLLYPCRNDSVLRRKYVIEVDIMSLRVSLVEKKHCQRIQHNPMSPRWIDEIVANKFIYLFNWSVQSLTKKLPAPSTYALDLLKRDT